MRKVTYEQIAEILYGIDLDETDHKDGWWTTSHGADFGKKCLAQIKSLFDAEATNT